MERAFGMPLAHRLTSKPCGTLILWIGISSGFLAVRGALCGASFADSWLAERPCAHEGGAGGAGDAPGAGAGACWATAMPDAQAMVSNVAPASATDV